MDLDDSTSILRHLLASEDLDRAFERIFAADALAAEASAVQVVVPGDVLAAGVDLPAFLETVLAQYDEIETVLSGLREVDAGDGSVDDAVAVVSEAELADPESLARALAPLQSETARLEFLFAQARAFLERLQVYRLSRCPPPMLVAILRQEHNLRTLQYLVEFLRSLQRAADSFEALALPQPHIRDYLQHLYSMGDWQQMRRLVRNLEASVGKMLAVGTVEGAAGSIVPADATERR